MHELLHIPNLCDELQDLKTFLRNEEMERVVGNHSLTGNVLDF